MAYIGLDVSYVGRRLEGAEEGLDEIVEILVDHAPEVSLVTSCCRF